MLGTRLQRKTLGVIGLTFVALVLVLYAVSRALVLGSFSEQERIDARQNVTRVAGALQDSLRALEGTARDWSLRDDTYNFMKDGNQAYYNANLATMASMMTSNQLNLVMFVDRDDRIVFGKVFDYRNALAMPVPSDLSQHIYPGGSLLAHTGAASSIKGVISLEETPMLLASEPIMRSDGTGPVEGTIIFGRFLDKEAIEHLSRVTLLGLNFTTVEAALSSGNTGDVVSTIGSSDEIVLRTPNDTTIAGYDLFEDVYGNPTLILEVSMPRDIYQRGEQTLNYYMLTLAAVGVVFALVIVALLRRLVLSRVANLRGDVRKISAATDMSGRVTPAGNDELTDLALSINEMLGSLQRAREEQREGEEKYRAVVEQTNEAILLADAGTGRFIEANAAGQILLGYDRDELLGMTVSDVVETQEKERDNTRLNTAPRATAPLRLSIEQRYRRKNGTSVHVEVSQIPITYGGREVRCIVARDITERKRAEDLLRELAMRDGLTGLYNRREMHRILKEQVEAYRRYAEPFTLIMLDIDYFKSVNDTYGHQVGDDVIRWIAAVTQDLVRVGDKVARYGGEEVALILPRTGREPAFEVAERIRQSIAKQPFEFVRSDAEGHEGPALIPLTVSLGLATLPDDGATEDEIIKAADTALYTAKRQGRNRTVTHAMTELERQPQVGAVGRN